MFLKSRSLNPTLRIKLGPLIQRGVILKEIIPDFEAPEEAHLICGLYQGITSHFYIYDNAEENQLVFLMDSVWKALHSGQDSKD